MSSSVKWLNPETGLWENAIPAPYPWPFHTWLWLRLIGWRDQYGRKASRSSKEAHDG